MSLERSVNTYEIESVIQVINSPHLLLKDFLFLNPFEKIKKTIEFFSKFISRKNHLFF